jgi:hypothetical protein
MAPMPFTAMPSGKSPHRRFSRRRRAASSAPTSLAIFWADTLQRSISAAAAPVAASDQPRGGTSEAGALRGPHFGGRLDEGIRRDSSPVR